eukprot:snap_masked-scaffold_36-processed-gene-2.101-mRNA-1 protein AED:1.00 eAED:1.00 QI:0/0/0/0/1/1/2/0/341
MSGKKPLNDNLNISLEKAREQNEHRRKRGDIERVKRKMFDSKSRQFLNTLVKLVVNGFNLSFLGVKSKLTFMLCFFAYIQRLDWFDSYFIDLSNTLKKTALARRGLDSLKQVYSKLVQCKLSQRQQNIKKVCLFTNAADLMAIEKFQSKSTLEQLYEEYIETIEAFHANFGAVLVVSFDSLFHEETFSESINFIPYHIPSSFQVRHPITLTFPEPKAKSKALGSKRIKTLDMRQFEIVYRAVTSTSRQVFFVLANLQSKEKYDDLIPSVSFDVWFEAALGQLLVDTLTLMMELIDDLYTKEVICVSSATKNLNISGQEFFIPLTFSNLSKLINKYQDEDGL